MAQTIFATKTVTIHPTRGKDINLVVGKPVTPGQFRKLTARQQRDYTMVAQPATTRHPWLYDEATDLVGCYVAANSHTTTAKQGYLTLNPNNNHSPHSVNAALGQLRAIDPNHPNDTRWVAKTTIIRAALETAPEYFDPTGDLQAAYYLAG